MSRWHIVLIAVLVALVLVVWPFVAGSYGMLLTMRILIYSVIVLSVTLLAGQLGLVSLAQTTFAGVAGYTIGFLAVVAGWPFPWPPLMAMAIGTVFAIIFGLVTMRAAGIYFLMLTLALGQMVWGLSFQWIGVTRGDDGITGIRRPVVAGIDLGDPIMFYFIVLACTVAVYTLGWLWLRSEFGLLMQGIRQNDRRMRALAHPILPVKLIAFILCGVIASLGGVLLVYETSIINPTSLDISRAIWVLTAAIVGGYRYLWGAPIGVVVLVMVETFVTQYTDRHLMVIGFVLLFTILLMPGGVAHLLATAWHRLWPRPAVASVGTRSGTHEDRRKS